MAQAAYPVGAKGQIIGQPYQGTHAKAFNVAGGSDNWQSENAVDIAVPAGTPVYAVAAGVISPKGMGFGQGGTGRFAGFRLHLVIPGNAFYYAHLSRIVVHPGDKVADGQLIAYSGSANGVDHLHFAAEHGDPNKYLSGQPGAAGADPAAATTPVDPAAATSPAAAPAAATPATNLPPPPNYVSPVQPPLVTPPMLAPPGSGGLNDYVPSQSGATWQMIASQPLASPEALRNAALTQ